MADREERDYYASREASSRARAAKSTDPHIRQIHMELADAYAVRAHVGEQAVVSQPRSARQG